jgi:hypothetical protein
VEEGASPAKLLLFWSFEDHDMERKEIFTIGILKCRNAKWKNKRKTLRIQSNGVGEFEYDWRATVSLHSVTARND